MTWLRTFVVVAICVVAFVALWLPGARSALDPSKAVEAADFPNYYFGGERLLNDRPIYDPLTTEVRDELGVSDYDTYPADPPPTVVIFSALSFLSYEAAWWLWQIASASLIAYSIIIVAREVGYFPQVAVAMAAFAFLTTPVRFLLTRNHMESLLLLLGVLGWRALRRGNASLGSVLWGIATGLKLFPGMWLLGRTGDQSGRFTFRGLGIAVAMSVIGALVVGFDNVEHFVTEVIPASSQWRGVLGNYSLLSVGTAFAGEWLGWLLLAVALSALLPLYMARDGSADAVFVMGTALALLVSPLTWLNYLVLVIPALIILSCHFELLGNLRERITFGVLTVALVGWGPIVTSSELISLVLSFIPTYGLIALFFIARARLIHHEEDQWQSTSATPYLPTV